MHGRVRGRESVVFNQVWLLVVGRQGRCNNVLDHLIVTLHAQNVGLFRVNGCLSKSR